jgi:ArsR family transcriptional regulator
MTNYIIRLILGCYIAILPHSHIVTLKKGLKMQIFEKQAGIAKAIAHPVRIAVLEFVKNEEQCVCDIAAAVGTERSNLSKHLSIMVNAGVLTSRKDGLKVMYRIKTPCVLKFLNCLRDCLKEQAAEQQQLLESLSK